MVVTEQKRRENKKRYCSVEGGACMEGEVGVEMGRGEGEGG